MKKLLVLSMMAGLFFSCQPKQESISDCRTHATSAELIETFANLNTNAIYDSVKYLANYVDPLIGTGGHGHTFPGATVPFGMVQLSPDTRKDSWDGCSGYHTSDNTILGFSHTHLSGTGCGDYGDIRLMPTIDKVQLVPGDEKATETGYRSKFDHKNEIAKAGYYSVLLDDYRIKVELTTGERFGFHRYTFPKSEQAHIIIDLFEAVTSEKILSSSINIENDHAISGFRKTKGWAKDHFVYFYAEFSKPFKSYGICSDGKISKTAKANGTNLQAHVDFETEEGEQILVKVGISAVDVEGAKNNVLSEMPDWNFDEQRIKAFALWNSEMERIDVQDQSKENKTIFYTAMYHTMVAPNLYSDADGRYRGHDLKVHNAGEKRQYTVFSLWDTFRTLHPLFTITQRERTSEMIHTFLDIYDKGGLLPVWELAANETWCMIGYHAIPVIADAWLNGIRDFDGKKALEAMVKSANSDHFGLSYYKAEGYIPSNGEGESVSKTLEYAYDDWCIARMAEDLGDTAIAHEFYQRAQYYKNIYDSETKFFRGKLNGGFVTPFDPTQVNFMLTEANTWQYNFFVPQDLNTHIQMMGGNNAYEKMLDQLFTSETKLTGRVQSDITGLIGQYAHGNEPSHNMAYLYNYIGKPAKSQKILYQVMNELYTTEKDGLSGNEDCGQMSAWYVMSALGFYPVTPASTYYVLGVPRFEQAVIYLENGKQFVVKAKNLAKENLYVKGVKLNGKSLKNSYISHADVMNGGVLEFEMTSNANTTWAIKAENCPVSTIETEKMPIVPSINASNNTFSDTLVVKMRHPEKDAVIYYTLDGTIPTQESIVYTAPITIDKSCSINAIAIFDGKTSKDVKATYFQINKGWSIQLGTKYDVQYHAGGNFALIDHQRGGANFRTGSWQGYHGVDVVATIDLGKNQKIKRIAGSFLQDEYSWILMPKEMTCFVSADGKNFTEIGTAKNTLSEKETGGIIQELEVKTNVEARFVKIIAKNYGNLPAHHVGVGEPAWIFIDEIIVE